MENRKHVIVAAVQGAAYGFDKGFESALDHLRATLAYMPGENSRALVTKLIESIEDCSFEARSGFLDDIELYVVTADDVEATTPQ